MDEQTLSRQLTEVLEGADASAMTWPDQREAYAWRLLRWEADQPLTAEQRALLTAQLEGCFSRAGVIGGSFTAEGDALNLLLCATRFPAATHRDTALWLCAHLLLEVTSVQLEQEGTMLIGEEFTAPGEWPEQTEGLREISEWWRKVSPIGGAEAHGHRAGLQMCVKRRQYASMGGYITRQLRGDNDLNRRCFGFVPLIIEAVWSRHAELSLSRLIEGLQLNEMTRRPREALMAWIDTLQPILRACPAAVNAAPIDRVISGIRADCSLPYSQANLSRSLGLTPAYFCRLFHEKTGQHFSTFLTMTRMEKAKGLLAAPGPHPLQEICARCGYPNKSYFCQVFKKYTGMTPGEYEQRTRGGDE